MKISQPLSKQLILAITLLFVVFACQEESMIEETDPSDEDMVLATELADDYMASHPGASAFGFAVTVLKSKEELEYKTNQLQGPYEGIDEETITAELGPGAYIFWYGGGGLSDLRGIEFDEESQELLDDEPFEIVPNLLWAVSIPNDILDEEDEDEEIYLKYDILYSLKGSSEVIRLDPKIKVSH